VERKEDESKKIKCFRCHEVGHHKMDYVNTPICYKCKEEGHIAVECVDYHSKFGDLKMFGFVIPDQGFYSMKILVDKETLKAVCIIQVLQGEASEKKIEEELKNVINRQWDWQVKQMDSNEFIVVFPDLNSIETFSKISKILMRIHGIKVKILKTNMDPEALEILQATWVKIYGLPAIACKEGVVMKVATLVGDPILVDEFSLIKTGPVRAKLNLILVDEFSLILVDEFQGLRQGPLSLMLFNIVAEVMSTMLRRAAEEGLIHEGHDSFTP
jgi:hypothetical protein